MDEITKIGLGGGCHWCTEAVYQSLIGVTKVEQGFVASDNENDSFSEAVIVHYREMDISLKELIAIHLHTHESTSDHSMRGKYRSAVYIFDTTQADRVKCILKELQQDFSKPLVTKPYPFKSFKPSDEMFQDYYYSDPEKPFCKRHIYPKLELLLDKFSNKVNTNQLGN
ncbi:peptide-methionine (S)-S-oxide reductase [Maribacter aestuarii]|uniref:peptide-methionine (S)-S-oxide reductase n=1 Tax=Maribacter aestuarii TaxID=1130723 RepID=UPI00248B282F|nr:peptide-methionine (S)-S-oxide reductase [Maribacter aestuarii]